LLGIEEILVETETFSIFAGRIGGAWDRRKHQWTVAKLNMVRAQVEVTGEKLEQHFVGFLLQEGMALDQARQRAAALSSALMDRGAAK
jgi:hypothetical protein